MQLITPDKLPEEVLLYLPKDVSEWARLALFLIAEQHKGQVRDYRLQSYFYYSFSISRAFHNAPKCVIFVIIKMAPHTER